MKISNEFKIGFWTIVAIAVLFFGIQYLKGINSLHLGQFYYIVCPNVEGLAASSSVRINGFQVGLVRSMEYDKKTGKVVVEVNLEDTDIKIPVDSKAEVKADLLGTSSIVITMGTFDQYLANRDTIPGGEMSAGLLDGVASLMPAINDLMPKIDSLVAGVNVLVNDSKVHESLLEINKLTEQLNVTVNNLNKMLKNDMPKILANVDGTTANLDSITSQINGSDVSALLKKANETLESTNNLVKALNSDEGTAGKIINTTELHDQLVETISSVDSLISDIKQNPKRYINIRVFGK